MRTRLERLLGIEEEIRSGRCPSLDSLCQSFSVKPRTIYEDIRILRERLGLKIQFDRARNGYFNAEPGKRLPAFDLSLEEFVLLLMGSELLCASLGADFKPILRRILSKIYERVPGCMNISFDHLYSSVQHCQILIEKIEVQPVAIDAWIHEHFGARK